MKRRLTILVAVIMLLAVACDEEVSYREKDEKTSRNLADKMQEAVPYPLADMDDSLERRNLKEKLLRFNDADKIGYVYLMSFGRFIGYYTIKGKVSSNQSQMTVTQEVIDRAEGDVVVDSISDDGSFGPNEEGVFFFTTTGTMVVTSLDYLYSDQPLPLDVPDLGEDA